MPSSTGTQRFNRPDLRAHHVCPAAQAPRNSTAWPAAIRFYGYDGHRITEDYPSKAPPIACLRPAPGNCTARTDPAQIRPPCVPSNTGTRKFHSTDLRAPCPATTCTQQHRHPEILQHGFERAPCVPSSTGTRKFSRRACSDPDLRAPCPATMCTQQHRHPEILQHGFESAPCVPSSTGTRKFNRTDLRGHYGHPAAQAPGNSTARNGLPSSTE